jgi:hypothetical protein
MYCVREQCCSLKSSQNIDILWPLEAFYSCVSSTTGDGNGYINTWPSCLGFSLSSTKSFACSNTRKPVTILLNHAFSFSPSHSSVHLGPHGICQSKPPPTFIATRLMNFSYQVQEHVPTTEDLLKEIFGEVDSDL